MNKRVIIIAVAALIVLAAVFMNMRGEKKPTLYVYNWGDYIDEDVIGKFEKSMMFGSFTIPSQLMKICMSR